MADGGIGEYFYNIANTYIIKTKKIPPMILVVC
jgi:hypothetical protein